MEKLRTTNVNDEEIVKIHLARSGIRWHGVEYNRFDVNWCDKNYIQVNSIANVEYESTKLVLHFECDDSGHCDYLMYDPQEQSDRTFAIRPFYPKDAIFVSVRFQTISVKNKISICSKRQIKHCEEMADIIKDLTERAKSEDLKEGENHIIFFGFLPDNKHVIQAMEDLRNGRWSLVTKHRHRLGIKGNGMITCPRTVMFSEDSRILRLDQ